MFINSFIEQNDISKLERLIIKLTFFFVQNDVYRY